MRVLQLWLACAVLMLPRGAATAGEQRPNVLVILTDDMRWDTLGVVQREQKENALFPWFQTPHLDRLAAEGSRFQNVFVTTSLCSPSRASLISGQYTHRHGVRNNFTDYPQPCQAIPADCSRRVMKPPTSANGTWGKTTTASVRASISG